MIRQFTIVFLLAGLVACTCEADRVFLSPEELPRPFLVTGVAYPFAKDGPNDRYDYVGILVQFNQPVDTSSLRLGNTVMTGGEGIIPDNPSIGTIMLLNSTSILVVTQRAPRVFSAPPVWEYFLRCQNQNCRLDLELLSDPRQDFGIRALQTRQYLDGNQDGTDGGDYSASLVFP